jgi:hypothetical protein
VGLVFAALATVARGTQVHGICIVLHFAFSAISWPALPCRGSSATKSLLVIYLSCRAIGILLVPSFGAANASVIGNKEAANSSNMTFTFIDTPHHYPNRFGRRNGTLHRLS